MRISTFGCSTMILLFDIGNTNTHVGLANERRVVRQTDIPTAAWRTGNAKPLLTRLVGQAGLAAMTDYLHEKTALLPRIKIREVQSAIGKGTEHAMLVGAMHGYRGLIHGLLAELKQELQARQLPVVATGGYAKLIASRLPEIFRVEPDLTLEGLRLVWNTTKAISPNR